MFLPLYIVNKFPVVGYENFNVQLKIKMQMQIPDVDGDVVCVSGYFDPLHIGHLEYFQKSKLRGDYLMVIVNNDKQAVLKKGRPFMPAKERVRIISELRCVDYVIESSDVDRTVCKSLTNANPRPAYFCNGGDQFNDGIPERQVCQDLGIELIDGLGEKIQSSSNLINEQIVRTRGPNQV